MKLPSHSVTSIGWRRYLMTVETIQSRHDDDPNSAGSILGPLKLRESLPSGRAGRQREITASSEGPQYDSLGGAALTVVWQNSGCGAAFSRGSVEVHSGAGELENLVSAIQPALASTMSAKAIDGLRCREAGVDSARGKRQVTAVPAELPLVGAF